MAQNKVKVTIGGIPYSLIAEDEAQYVKAVAKEVDLALDKILKENNSISLNQASVLLALDYADQAQKEMVAADHLREQIKDYLNDASNAKTKADKAQKEVEKLSLELDAALNEVERLKLLVPAKPEKKTKK